MGRFGAWLGRMTSVQRGEVAPAAFAFCYIFLIIASYTLLKTVRDSLYISEYGAVKLPYVMIGIAVLVGIFVDLYIRLSRRVAVEPLTAGTLVFFIANLGFFWMLARNDTPWLYPLLYVWAGCYGVIAPVQFWTIANDVFSTRDAKRLFGVVGAGGILGGFVGGKTASLLAAKLGTVNLLLIVAGILVAASMLALLLFRYRMPEAEGAKRERRPTSLRESVAAIARSRHLRVLAGLVWVGALSTTIIDYQFKAAAGGAGFTRDELTIFFGNAYGYFSLASFLVQVFVVRLVFRRFGLGIAIVMLPIALFGGTLTFMLAGTLWAATFMKAGDGALKHSMDRSSKELAYLPVPRALKVQAKSAIDMVMDRLGDGTGGIVLLLLATTLEIGALPIAVVNAVFLGIWLLLAFKVRRSYLDELSDSIARGEIDESVPTVSLRDSDARLALVRALRDPDPGRVVAALEIAALAPGDDLKPEIERLAREGVPEVKHRALGLLLEPNAEHLPSGIASHLEADDQDLLVKVFDIVLAQDEEELRQRAIALMGDGSPETRGALLALLVRRLGGDFAPVADTMMTALISPRTPATVREAAAVALGLLPASSPLAVNLGALMSDPDAAVRARAAESAGRLGSAELAPSLVHLLGEAMTRGAARRALLALGPEAVPVLLAALASPRTDPAVRTRIPRLLADIDSGTAIEALIVGLGSDSVPLFEACLDALVRVRRGAPETPLGDVDRVRERVMAEVAHAESIGRLVRAVRSVKSSESEFLAGALDEALERSLEVVFKLLELCHSPRQISRVRKNVTNSNKVQRDNALELLETLLPREISVRLLPLVESVVQGGPAIRSSFEESIAENKELALQGALAELSRSRDPWLAACAMNVAGRYGWPGAVEAAVASLSAGDAALRSEASRVLSRDNDLGIAANGAITLVDKVIALRSIDAFRAVGTRQLTHVARVARERSFLPGEVLFAEGDPPGALFFLLDGTVGLRRANEPAGTVESGSALGTWSLFDDQPRAMGAVALGHTKTLVVERDDFYDVLAEQPGIVRSLMADMGRRLKLDFV